MEWKKRKAILAGLAFGLAASATLSHAQFPPSRFVSQPGRVSGGEKEEAVAEALIRQRVEDWAKAISAKDIDGVMSFYAPKIVSFDITPPLRYVGADNKRRRWQEVFARSTGPIAYEVRDLNVTTHGGLAFVHSLNHVKGTPASGHITDMWVRWTACFQRIDGVWLVVHDHVSVPADLEHGQAVMNLTP
jgi:ketosteroid isomerase-like protein